MQFSHKIIYFHDKMLVTLKREIRVGTIFFPAQVYSNGYDAWIPKITWYFGYCTRLSFKPAPNHGCCYQICTLTDTLSDSLQTCLYIIDAVFKAYTRSMRYSFIDRSPWWKASIKYFMNMGWIYPCLNLLSIPRNMQTIQCLFWCGY